MFTFRHHFHGLVAYCNIYQIKTFLSMCGSRKYPYHPHRRDLPYDPHSPLDFPKSVPNVYPPFPQEGNRYLVLFTRMPNFVSFMNFLLNSIADIKANSLCKFLMHSSHKQICEFHAFFDFLFHSQHQESNIINKRAGSCPTIKQSKYPTLLNQIRIFDLVVKLWVTNFIHNKIVLQCLMCWKRLVQRFRNKGTVKSRKPN